MEKRTNPFKSQNRTNFPPLDDFFADDTTNNNNDQRSDYYDDDAATDPGNNSYALTRSASNHSFHSRSKTCNDILNFSVDMSIGGKADLAQHRYQVQKYGLDDSYQLLGSPFRGSPTCTTPSKKGRRYLYGGGGGGDDTWDRLMDDTNCSNVSFSSTAIVGGIKSPHHTTNKAAVGYHTPSPEESPDQSVDSNDTSSDYLGKSVIQSLVTPEKRRYKLSSSDKTSGVTYTRGQIQHYESSEDEDEGDDNSPQRSATNISHLSTGSGFERMFHAALRFNEDFDYESSFIKEENESSVEADNNSRSKEKEDGRDRYSSVSFAADTSFATSDGKFLATLCQQNKRQQENHIKHCTEGEEVQKEQFNNKDTLKELDLSSASPIHHDQDNSFGGANLSFGEGSSPSSNEVSSLESPGLTPSPNTSGETKSLQKPCATDLQFLGLSPIDNLKSADRRTLRSPTIAPFDEKHRASGVVSSHVPFNESSQSNKVQHANSHSSLMTDCTKRNLFQEDEKDIACNNASHELEIEISHDSIEMMVQQKKSPIDQCCTHTTVKSEESYFDNDVVLPTTTTSLSEEVSPYRYTRTFGSNAAFRINSNFTNVGRSLCDSDMNDDCTFHDDGGRHRRGVRLCRLSKMKELGLDHALLTQSRKKSSTSWEQCGDNSF